MTPERWQKIEQVYQEALERGETQRGAYLQEVCAGDDALRREVESLLAQDNRAGQFLEKPAMEDFARVLAEDERQHSLIGKRLASYQIVSKVGVGGMGEVYKARDTRLDRFVAIKVLPTHLADRAELRERFEREARTIASLNHPHICTLHDIGHQDGTDFLVMEYLEGETLAQRLQKGSLPIQQVLQYAIEIADALDKAHRKGVTHRDLKPGNIMLTKLGAKLLDFGLAKLKEDLAPANVPLSELPTVDDPLTAKGAIVGTLQYMAPEQLEAKEVDARTDIFAFGAVVYEMATGKKAFEGTSQASLIARILETDPPPISSLRPMTPPALDRVVRKCLAKEAEKRWQAASDVCDELKWVAETISESAQTKALEAAPARQRKVPLRTAGLIAAIVAVVTGLTIWYLKPNSLSNSPMVSRFTITLPPGDHLAALDTLAIAMSPDGRSLVYVANRGDTQQLYLRNIDSLEASPIRGTENAMSPFLSPDGQWVGFYAEKKLKKIPITGGSSTTISSLGGAYILGATWGSYGNIVFVNGGLSDIEQVSASGGIPKHVSSLDAKTGEIAQRWPVFLPDDKAVLFTSIASTQNSSNGQISLRVLGSGERRDLIPWGSRPAYAPTGHLIYAQAGTLMAVPFDSRRLEVTGPSIPVLEGVMGSEDSGVSQFSLSKSGALAYFPGGMEGGQHLVWVDRKGVEQPLAAPTRSYGYPRLSPDGRQIAVTLNGQIWVYDVTRGTFTRLTFQGSSTNPAWTRDGKRVVFQTTNGGPFNLFWQLADGSGAPERLSNSEARQAAGSFSADGQLLAFSETTATTGVDILVLRLGDRKAQPFLQTPANEGDPQFSLDGHWLAYSSNESGRSEVYVRPYPGPGGRWQVSTDGGTEPIWNPNGRELFYRDGNRMLAVDISTQPVFAPGKTKVLFEGPYLRTSAALPYYDVTPDGQRFLMVKKSEPEREATRINVVLNWFEELKQKVPTEKK